MKKTSKTSKKKTNKRKANRVSSMMGIVAAILIVLGVGGYFLGNESTLGGSFNASTSPSKIVVTGANFLVQIMRWQLDTLYIYQ